LAGASDVLIDEVAEIVGSEQRAGADLDDSDLPAPNKPEQRWA
jgi:hypothetical protein